MNLVSNGAGGMRCSAGHECKGATCGGGAEFVATWQGGGQAGCKGKGKWGEAPDESGFMEGDWSCPGCGDHQFARNMECRKCQTPNPGGAATEKKVLRMQAQSSWAMNMVADNAAAMNWQNPHIGKGGGAAKNGWNNLGGGAAGDVNLCSTHHKRRTVKNLIDDGNGGMCCAPGNECQENVSPHSAGGKAKGAAKGKGWSPY